MKLYFLVVFDINIVNEIVHNISEKNTDFFKGFCSFIFEYWLKLYWMIRLLRSFKCIYCLKLFSSLPKLKQYQQLHTGMNCFGFNHRNGIEWSSILIMKNFRHNVYSGDKQFNCSFQKQFISSLIASCVASSFLQVVTNTIIWKLTVV